MKKVLVGYIIDGKKSGIDKYLLNMLAILDKEQYKVDFLTNKIDSDLQEYLKTFNSDVYEIPTLKNPLGQVRTIRNLIKHNQYDVAYFNISEAFNCTGLFAAWLSKVPKRIIHSHSSGCDSASKLKWVKILLHNIAKQLLPLWATDYVTCSDKAKEWMFPKRLNQDKNVELILNGVDVEKFAYSEEKREEVRTKMNWNDKKVLLHVGSFLYVKNHPFLVQLIQKLSQKDSSYCLVLVGDGPLREQIENMVHEYNVTNFVEFLGIRKDVHELMQGSDYFVLPSHFEGLPLTAVEAQIAGNVCVLSANITRDAKLSKFCEYESISNVDAWVEQIEKYSSTKKEAFENITDKVIDIKKQTILFEQLFK